MFSSELELQTVGVYVYMDLLQERRLLDSLEATVLYAQPSPLSISIVLESFLSKMVILNDVLKTSFL